MQPKFYPSIEQDFGIEIIDRHRFHFTNMPISRFRQQLEETGEYNEYMNRLAESFDQEATEDLTCRSLINVGYDGRLSDCDFNYALDLPMRGPARTIWDLDDLSALVGNEIATGSHCFGCTAGAGSSCGGALT